MLTALIGIVIGLTLLAVAADQFVAGAVRLSIRARIAPVIVGAIILGFGTSLPEFLVSALAAAQNAVDLGVANVVGSNAANLTLVLGVALLIAPMTIPKAVKRRELPLAVGLTLLFAGIIQQTLNVSQGVLLLGLFGAGLVLMIWLARDDQPQPLTTTLPTRFTALRIIGGLGATLAGAQILIVSALSFADTLGIAEGVVGVTLVAIGTSLPELATTVAAARRKQTALIIGNLLGSNLFNAGAVGAITVIVGAGATVDAAISEVATVIMLAVTFVVTVSAVIFTRLPRVVGALLIAGYLASLPLLF